MNTPEESTGSIIVEENVSSGEDSSQTSGVYKNIIINLSNLAKSDSKPMLIPQSKSQQTNQSHSHLVRHQYQTQPPPTSASSVTTFVRPGSNSKFAGVGSSGQAEIIGILKKTR